MPTFDSYAPSKAGPIDQAAPTSNYGGLTIYVGDSSTSAASRGLLQWDLSSIPAGAVVSSATLAMTVKSDFSANARTLSVYRVLRNFVQAQATWNIYSTGNNWGTAGCSNTTSDRESSAIGTAAVAASPSTDSVISISLSTSAVQAWISGAFANNGMLLQVDTETSDQIGYYGLDEGTSTKRPRLTIVYTALGGTSTISGAMTATMNVARYHVVNYSIPSNQVNVNIEDL